MKETFQSLIDRFQALRHSWAQIPDTAFEREQVWFAGLAVSPVDFSGQLSKLQTSLERENSGVKFPSPTVAT